MLKRTGLFFAALTCAIATGCGSGGTFEEPDPSRITLSNVERVIGDLAADSMRGRRAFTADAERAAEYLAEEFARAGLEAPPGGHLQTFAVRSVEQEEAQVALNGELLPADQFMVRASETNAFWATGQGTVLQVGVTDSIQSVLPEILGSPDDILVLMPPERADLFGSLARLLARPARTLEGGEGPNIAMAIWDGEGEPAFEVEARAVVTRLPSANVVGQIPGRRSDEFVLFSAHYDHIGIRSVVDGDSIGNGANDDASGTTAVVELARYFASRGTPERTLLFAAFTAEEAGGFGSRHYSRQLDPDQVVAMFNIEMIGKPAVEGPNTAWITGFERSSFGSLLQDAVRGTQYAFYPDPYPQQNLFYRSDNATLARLGVPAHSISTTPIDVDADYHTVTDEVATLDLDHMTNTIRAIATGAEGIIAGRTTPSRVDPATVAPR